MLRKTLVTLVSVAALGLGPWRLTAVAAVAAVAVAVVTAEWTVVAVSAAVLARWECPVALLEDQAQAR